MELSGKIIQILPLQEGTGKNGAWKKQDFILEVPGNYPKKVCVTVWGERIDDFKIKEEESLTFSIDVESREYNGRWYTDVKAWKVSRAEQEGMINPPDSGTPNPGTLAPDDFQLNDQSEEEDDLPF